MALSLLELLRTVTSFSPERRDLSQAPWEDYVDWAIAQGLGPLSAYSLEYRLGQVGAPTWAKDRLLSIYQGTANDNVMKLIGFKNSVKELTGRRIVLLGGASFAESLYPHVAMRPVIEVEVLVPRRDVEPFVNWLRRSDFVSEAPAGRADAVVSDGHSTILVHGGLLEDEAEQEGLFRRALSARAYGASVHRLDLEDALLLHVLVLARAGFERPFIEWIDLREALLGAPATGGAYSRPLDAEVVLRRARAWKLERALWAALEVTRRLFPETEGFAARVRPELSFPVKELLERGVVEPLAEVGRTSGLKGAESLRALLLGA